VGEQKAGDAVAVQNRAPVRKMMVSRGNRFYSSGGKETRNLVLRGSSEKMKRPGNWAEERGKVEVERIHRLGASGRSFHLLRTGGGGPLVRRPEEKPQERNSNFRGAGKKRNTAGSAPDLSNLRCRAVFNQGKHDGQLSMSRRDKKLAPDMVTDVSRTHLGRRRGMAGME